MIGRIVGNYQIVERLGEGGMGTVYRAIDPMLERDVAVKAIRPELAREPQVVERFRAEAKLLARVSHPAIATIYSFFRDGDELFLAMEFVRGRTLASALSARGAFTWQEALPLLIAALAGIEQVHRLDIVHRDLKPDNLMLTEDGGIKVMDFGIARAVGSERLTRTGLMVGTLRYMPPEQLRGEAGDRRADIYALGTVLYEMLVGRAPFASASEYEVIRAQVEELPSPPSSLAAGVPAWLDRAVLRALAKEPADRFQSAEAFRAALAGAGGERPSMAAGALATSPQRSVGEVTLRASLPTEVRGAAGRRAAAPAAAPPVATPAPVAAMPAPSRRRWVIAAVVVLAFALAIWGRRARLARLEATVSPPPASAPVVPPAVVSAAAPHRPEASTGRAVETAATPPAASSAPAPQRRIAAGAASAAPSPASAEASTPAVAAANPAASPAAPADSGEPMERLGELRATGRDLDAAVGRLADAYRRFLAGRRGGGFLERPAEPRLQSAIEDIVVATSRFRYAVRPGVTSIPFAVPEAAGGDRRTVILALARRTSRGGQQIDRLIRFVRPGTEVEEAWREVERLSRQLVETLAR